jgi:PKHD-type hydroxylase
MSAIVLPGVVPVKALAQLRKLMAMGPFVSGKLSAVGRAASIKDNLLLAPNSPGEREAVELVTGALQASAAFQIAAWPEAMLRPQICRYAEGMTYGDHVDGAIMGQGAEQIRCDVAVTVCISDASDYDGGELLIDTAGVPRAWKGNAGDAIVYPADTLHRVAAEPGARARAAPDPVRSSCGAGCARRVAVAAAGNRKSTTQLLHSDSHVGLTARQAVFLSQDDGQPSLKHS